MSKPTVIGVMLAFLHRQASHNSNVWSDGKRLESHRVILGKWRRGEINPTIQPLAPDVLQTCGAPRTVLKHHGWYKELLNYHVNNVN